MIISDGRKIKVYNGTANTIDINKVVVVKGKRVTLASNTNTDAVEYPLGYTLSSISPGGYGEVLLEGSIQNINSSSYSDSALLYLSTNGNITTTKPATSIIIGAVITSDPTSGSIYFKVFFPKTTWGDITGNVSDQTDLQNELNVRVPYEGADHNVDLGIYSIRMNDGTHDTEMSPSFFGVETAGGLQFSLLEYNQLTISDTTIPSLMLITSTGITFPDGSVQTTAARIELPSGGATGDILAKASATDYDVEWIENYTSSVKHTVKLAENINKGQAVYVSSADGTNIIVSKASNASEATSSKTMGLLAFTGITNDQGFVITEGLLAGLDTNLANVGDPVWLGTDGDLIFGLANKPIAPEHLVFIGIVTRRQQNNGEIFVKVQNGFELKEIHDVKITSPTNGQALVYNSSNGLWENNTVTATVNVKTINGDSIVGSGNELIFNTDRAKYGYEYFNDFLLTLVANGASDATGLISFFSGTGASLTLSPTPSIRESNQQGFLQFNTGTIATGYTGVYGTTVANNFLMLGGGVMTYITSIFIPTLSTSVERFRVTSGYGNIATNVAETNGVFFTYDEGGTQNGTAASPYWQCVTVAGGVRTLTTTTVLASNTAWQKLSIQINNAATSVEFYIDNVLVATHSSNIPSGTSQLVTPKLQIVKTVGTTNRAYYADYIGYRQTYTTAKL